MGWSAFWRKVFGPRPTPRELAEQELAKLRALGRHGYVECVIESGTETYSVVETDPIMDRFRHDEWLRRQRAMRERGWLWPQP